MKKKIVIFGMGGQAKVVLDMCMKLDYEILGFLVDSDVEYDICGYKKIGTSEDAVKYKDEAEFVIAIGNCETRERISDKYNMLSYATIVHPNAIIGSGVDLGEGTVVMPNVVISPFAKIGRHCIINTASIVEHDCKIGDFVHVSIKAGVSGTVTIGNKSVVGAGGVVVNNVKICDNAIIGAGAVVAKDITEPGTYVGVPAKKIK